MGFVVKNKSSVYLKEEVTEGIYIAPVVGDAIEVLSDGVGFEYTREEVQRNLLSSTIEINASRVGLASVSGSIPVEFKAGAAEGAYPREKVLLKSLLGGQRQISTTSVTKAGNTSTVLQIEDADISKYNKGDIIVIKQSGAYEARPISGIDATIAAAEITLGVALSSAPADNVVISKSSTFYPADNAPTFSVTNYVGGDIKEEVTGCRSVSASLESWEGGAVSNFNFSVEGLDLAQSVESLPAPLIPNFSGDALPPVILNACVWINGVKVAYNSLSLTFENTKAEVLSACSASGKSGSRFTQFVVSGEIAPYMDDDNVDRFDSFNNNSTISIFGYAYNPSATLGQIEQVVAFWLPQAKITAMPNGDQDGIMTNQISFKAYKSEGGDSAFIGFI
jgi:aspartate 1-decarboxylase